MPSKTPKQARFMRAVANNPEFARKVDVPQSVGREFEAADNKVHAFYGGPLNRLAQDAFNRSGKQQAGEPFADKSLGKSTRRKLAKDGWTLANGMWYPPQGTLGWQVAGSGLSPYHIPRAPEGPITADMLEPGSIAREIYDKYGIIDQTATRYDLTDQAKFKDDPYAHLEADDPARIQYEQWDEDRGHRFDQPPPERDLGALAVYAEPSESRKSNVHRTRLREHQDRIGDILGVPSGNAEGGPVKMYAGGLAAAAMMRRRQNPRFRGNDMRQPPKRVGMAPPRRARPGVMPGRQFMPTGGRPREPMVQPDDARMPGGRAMPQRGLLQKMQAARRQAPSHRIGMRDQQGGLSRALQTRTGRPPISRRAAFPGSRQNQY